MTTTDAAEGFDAALVASLLPALVALADHSALLTATTEGDPDARAGKLEVGRQVSLTESVPGERRSSARGQASLLRSTLAALRAQAHALPAGELSLDDQAYLIQRLEQEVEKKRSVSLIKWNLDSGSRSVTGRDSRASPSSSPPSRPRWRPTEPFPNPGCKTCTVDMSHGPAPRQPWLLASTHLMSGPCDHSAPSRSTSASAFSSEYCSPQRPRARTPQSRLETALVRDLDELRLDDAARVQRVRGEEP